MSSTFTHLPVEGISRRECVPISEKRAKKMGRRSLMGRVREGPDQSVTSGYFVTWDVNSKDRPTVDRVRQFVFGHRVQSHGRTYVYPGFVDRQGVRYLAQSALLVRADLRDDICAFLAAF